MVDSRDSGRDVLLVVVLALVVRVLFCVAVYPRLEPGFANPDGYDVIGRNLAAGKGFLLDHAPAAAERLPLYPAVLATSFVLFGDASWPWQLAQCVLGALTCGVVVRTARGFATRAAALAAGVVCTGHPTLVLYAARPLTETLHVFLLVLFVAALVEPPRPAMSGVLLGLQLLTKSTAFLHLLALGPLLRRHPAAAVRAAVLAALVVAPWVGWNLWTSGEPHLLTATAGRNLYAGLFISRHVGWTTPAGELNAEADWALFDDARRHGVRFTGNVEQDDPAAGALARAWIAEHPGEAARLWMRNVALTWYLGRSRASMLVHLVLHGVLLAAAGVGAAHLAARPATRGLAVSLVLLVAAYTLCHAVIKPGVRYILPAVPLAALLAAGVAPRAEDGEPR